MTEYGEIRRWQISTTALIVVLAVVATMLGLFREGFYRDPEVILHQAYGQDTVTLLGVVPLLAGGLWLALRGSLRGYVLWLGALGYMTYTYAVFAVITQFNPFFLGYVALFGLSAYTLAAGILQLDPNVVKGRFDGTLPIRALVWFFVAMGILVTFLWLSEVVPATLANESPPSIADTGIPANVVHVLDLAILIPALFITAWWLHERRPWGYVLPGVFFVKLTTMGVAILAMIGWMQLEGHPVRLEEIVVFVVLTVANGAFAVPYFRSIQ
jgi:hypothetical protein